MDGYFVNSPLEGEDDGTLFPDFLMADSQISNLDLSSPEPGSDHHQPFRPSALPSTVPSSPPSANPWYDPAAPRAGRRDPGRHDLLPDNFESWEADADFIDSRSVPHKPNESQQDLAERINSLTRTINANAAFCLEVSGKMIELARENKHLLDASKSTLDTYVLQPCLRLPGILQTYYPGIQDGLQDGLEALKVYESQLRRTVQNCANGRDMARAQGIAGKDGGSRGEMTRLKDRLVEQDALLKDSSQHVQRLIREREALKKQLDARKRDSGKVVDALGLLAEDVIPDSEQRGKNPTPDFDYDGHGGREQPGSERDLVALADHLREMRVLMDRMALHEASNHERHNSTTGDDTEEGYAADDEDPDWTLL
ncbi:hypothetical protein JX265_000958 [Neoarthrinium moseri]|uniref:Uncharacterized protein n=1 Tax=Neoarthrinium moseri TaxID=1658444 RepID=A0A9P9WX59_9PEZI|nr:hypothetical protein JX265_000958 [Neoarthrinium moseri]